MNQRGFSIIEALIALAILSTVIASVIPIFISFSQANLQSQRRTEAIALSQIAVDGLRREPFTMWPESGTVHSQASDTGTEYNVKTSFCTNELPFCDSGARHTRVEVMKDGKTYYQVETVYTQFDVPE